MPTWETAADWDSAQSEEGIRHPSNVLQKGYPQTASEWDDWPVPAPDNYWPYNDGTGTTVTDTINGDDFSYNGGTWNTGGILNGSYIDHDGIDDYGSSSTSVVANSSNGFAFHAWVFFESDSTYDKILSYDESGSYGIVRLVIRDTGTPEIEAEVGNGSSTIQTIIGSTTISTGTWYSVGLSYDPNTDFTIYLNGSSDASMTPGGMPPVATPLNVGRDKRYTSDYLTGGVQHVMQWGQPLSASAFSTLYETAI